MSHKERLLHDFIDSFFALGIHTRKLTSSLATMALNENERDALEAVTVSMNQLKLLIEQLRSSYAEDGSGELVPVPVSKWSKQIEIEILPDITRMHATSFRYKGIDSSDSCVIVNMPHFARICCNLIANAKVAGADHLELELKEEAHGIDLIFRDNGIGMRVEQIEALGLGYSSKDGNGHGQGFRIVRKLAAECGAVVRTPVSIVGLGTEIRISFMKVGMSARD